jgi:hypothetical protein
MAGRVDNIGDARAQDCGRLLPQLLLQTYDRQQAAEVLRTCVVNGIKIN